MLPLLPTVEALTPYLRRVDANRHYTNFGPLQEELAEKILDLCPRSKSHAFHAVCVSNCTLGLELAISALGLPSGSRIGLPVFTFIATASAILRCGYVPVVFDVDSRDWMLRPQNLAGDSEDLAAVIPVSVFGMPQDVDSWAAWSKRSGVPVIIDAAGGIGAQPLDESITVVFSLHATKPLPAGEGGVVVTGDECLAKRIRRMSDFGLGLTDPTVGTNAKLSEYHSAVALASLDTWHLQCEQRRFLYEHYTNMLSQSCGTGVEFQEDRGHVAPCIFPVLLANRDVRSQLEESLALSRVETRKWYLPLIKNLSMLNGIESPVPTPNADSISDRLLGLPFYSTLEISEIDYISRLAMKVLRN